MKIKVQGSVIEELGMELGKRKTENDNLDVDLKKNHTLVH
jgi:hypothetical protein